jgi:murein DD-endopeptidase MepM/ murein hydrolase activator NlpD
MTFANFDITALGSAAPAQATRTPDEAAVRKMAADFEALLLRQLTASINPASDDEDGESLFGQDSGAGLSRQLFSEQMADSMAQNGGIGLAEMIVKQVLNKRAEKPGPNLNPESKRAFDAARSVRANSSSRAEVSASAGASQGRLNRNRALAEDDRYPDAIIISRASDNNEPIDSSSATSSETLSGVSEIDSPDSPTADASPTPVRPKGLVSEQDVFHRVRPRRVFPLPPVEQSLPLSGISPAPATSRVVNAPSARAVAAAGMSTGPVDLQMYVRGPIRSRFGPRIDPIDKVPRFHRGVDIAAPTGTPIGAASAGRVIFSGRDKGHGNMVAIEHPDGTITRYAHASQLLVKVGDYVESGQTVALVGSTGHSTGPHLHFEVIKNGIFVDPLRVLPKGFALARR